MIDLLNIIKKYFPNMHDTDIKLIVKYLDYTLEILKYLYGFDDDEFILIMTQNNNEHIIWLLTYLLPFINNVYKPHSSLISLKNIYTEQNINVNIKETEPKYTWSTVQYERIKKDYVEVEYGETDLRNNYLLLIETLLESRYRLSTNFINIIPFSIDDLRWKNMKLSTTKKLRKIYDNTNIKELKYYNLNQNTLPSDIISNISNGLYVGAIYNVLNNYLYTNMIKYKWLLYDINYNNNNIPIYLVLKNIFDQKTSISNIFNICLECVKKKTSYNNLDSNNIELFIKILNNSFKKRNVEEDELDDELLKTGNVAYIRTDDKYFTQLEIFYTNSIELFESSWYGITLKNMSISQYTTKYNNNSYLIKMVYNYCKELMNNKFLDKYVKIHNYWESLLDSQKDNFIEKINTFEWFDMKSYIENLGLTKTSQYYYKNIINDIKDIIFETLIYSGTLTCIIPQKEIINEDNYRKILGGTILKNHNEIYNSAYSPIANIPYGELNGGDYFETILTKMKWILFDAYNFISQIGFIHRFIHTRVCFITGATGAGKSSQIPKLYLYYLKALDYKFNGNVVCTLPRIEPTEDTAFGIGMTLGVPLINDAGLRTDKFYVQFKHQKDSHVAYKSYNILKCITDGSLVLEINNPLMKKIIDLKENSTINKKQIIKPENLYDVIIIDESHEHNANMDLILTFIRNGLNINNSVRLCIMSATIDDDEATYRRYYKNINDNIKYPINININTEKIERKYVDRRFHISSPYRTTLYKIDDIYVPNEKIENIIKKILNESEEGDILIFQPGAAEIKQLCMKLNEQTPPNVIALPFYGELDSYKRNFIKKIGNKENRILIKMNKTQDFLKTEDITKGQGNYNRFIIIATNVAEASITISTLKYVIESGTQKVKKYDYLKRINSLTILPISETNRLQRKGRVGRVSSGTVYYLYEENKTLGVKMQYKICLEDLTYNIFQYLKTDDLDMIYINFDPNENKIVKLEDGAIANQYMIDGKIFKYSGDFIYKPFKHKFYTSGYDKNSLIDSKGKFYIIHPNELQYTRNILGKIVKKEDTTKMESFFENLIGYLYITPDYEKTKFGIHLHDINGKISAIDDYNAKKTVIFSYLFSDLRVNVMRIFSLLSTIRFNYKFLFDKKSKIDVNIIKNMFLNNNCDFDVAEEIMESYITFMNDYIDKTQIDKLMFKKSLPIYYEKIHEFIEKDNVDDLYIRKLFFDAIYDTVMDVNKDDKFLIKYGYDVNNLKKAYITYQKLKVELKSVKSNIWNELKMEIKEKFNNIENISVSNLISFMYPFNICKKINKSNKYLSIFDIDKVYTYKIGSMVNKKYIPNTFVNLKYLNDYIIYLNLDSEKNEISCLCNYDKNNSIVSTLPINIINKKLNEYDIEKNYSDNEDINHTRKEVLKDFI